MGSISSISEVIWLELDEELSTSYSSWVCLEGLSLELEALSLCCWLQLQTEHDSWQLQKNGCTEIQNASSKVSFSLMTGKCGSMWIELNIAESLTRSRIELTWTKSASKIKRIMKHRRRCLQVFMSVKYEWSLHSMLFWSLYQWAAVAERIMRRTSKPFHAGSNPVSCTKNEEWCKVHGRSLKPYSLLRAAWVRFPAPQPKVWMI